MRQTALIIELADQAGYEIHSPRPVEHRAGTITVRPDHAYEVSRELLARNIIIDYREGAGIRVAPHFYNTDDEVRSVFTAIKDILQSGEWQRQARDRAFVT
jgi:kynureninase